MSAAEERDNERRRDRVDAIEAELAKASAKAAQLRKAYVEAVAAERAPKPPAPDEAVVALNKRRGELVAHLEELRHLRSKRALLAAEGDAKAKADLETAVDALAAGEVDLENLDLAIKQAEARDSEQRHEALQRDSDEKFRAGTEAADELNVWAEKLDNLLGCLGVHCAEFPDLQKALAKSGANIDTDRTNMIFSTAARDRAAKAAGLHRFFSMDSTVSAAPLADAFRRLLKAAVRRPS